MGVSIPGKCILLLFAYKCHDPAKPFFLHLPMAFTMTTQMYPKKPWQSTLALQPNILYMQHLWGAEEDNSQRQQCYNSAVNTCNGL